MLVSALIVMVVAALFYWIFIVPARAEKERRRRLPGATWHAEPWDSGRRGPR